MEVPVSIVEHQIKSSKNSKIKSYIPYVLLYIVLFAIVWYGLPNIDEQYHFFIKCLMFSLPVIFGIQSVTSEFIEEEFDNFKNIKINKIKYQLVDVANKDTLALVDEDGNVNFLTNINNISKKKKQSKNKNNWYKNLKKK